MKILVVRFSSLGDVVLTTALFPNLRAFWPTAEIAVLVKKEFSAVFERNPDLNKIIAFDQENESTLHLVRRLRLESFDLILDLHGNLRSWLLRVAGSTKKAVVVDKKTWLRRKMVWFKRSNLTNCSAR